MTTPTQIHDAGIQAVEAALAEYFLPLGWHPMSIPHPFVNEGYSIDLNCPEIAKASLARARHEGSISDTLICDMHGLQCAIATMIDRAELIRAGKRFERGEGATDRVVPGEIGSGCSDIPEAHMNAAQDVFGATDPATNDKLRAVVRAVRAIDKATLNEAFTRIAAEGGAAQDTYWTGFNAGIDRAMRHLEKIDASDTRIARPVTALLQQAAE